MQRSQPSLFTRHDTFFGVCEAIGQDFRFNANWLRLGFGVGLLLSPLATVAVYLGLGVVIAVSRWFFPAHRAEVRPVAAQTVASSDRLKSDNDAGVVELATAA